jgi:FKBP-type peptidyl-prolyl cis-trans isomerase FkpA
MSVTAVPLRPIAKGSVAKLWVGLLLLALAAAAAAWWGTAAQQWTTTASGLQYRVVKDGKGATATDNDFVFIDYVGRLQDGTVFDTTAGKQPALLPVRPGGLIPGFSEGLHLVKKDGVYKLRIPGKIAYGERGSPPKIPPNATLDFDIRVADIVPEETLRAMMMQQQLQQQMQQQQGQGQPGQQGAGQAPPAEAPPVQ